MGWFQECKEEGQKAYRRQHGNQILKDDRNNPYEYHHIDFNHLNDVVSNVMYISIDEHYNIHKAALDYLAISRMVNRERESHESNFHGWQVWVLKVYRDTIY